METPDKSTMKEINSLKPFRKKKSKEESNEESKEKSKVDSKNGSSTGTMLRLILAAGIVAAFFITRQGVLDPKPSTRKALGDSELRETITTMALTDPVAPKPGSREDRLASFGKKLFFDTRLSSNGKMSCATCHQPDKFFTDSLPTARGTGTTTRNTPTILNSGMAHWFFWDGRADSLAAQAVGPLENQSEHGLTRSSLAALIELHYRDEYVQLFGNLKKIHPTQAQVETGPTNASPKKLAAYTLASIGPYQRLTDVLKLASDKGLQPSSLIAEFLFRGQHVDSDARATEVAANVGTALATWERLQIANQSAFDGYLKRVTENPKSSLQSLTNESDFTAMALAGLRIFTGRGNCSLCHRGALLSDQQFHNIGLGDTPRQRDLPIQSWLEDVAGRAKGQFDVRQSEFNCQSRVWQNAGDLNATRQSESCREQEFLDLESFESVGAFKTPPLRNVAMTAPYFHDGRAATLDEVLQHYDQLKAEPVIGHREESLRPLDLSAEEKAALKAFLESLTSPARDLSRQ